MASKGDEGVMVEVITLINRLHDVTSSSNLPPTYLDLPQMAVVGEQSAGKSSVLETIVGKDFLPRGTDIVTRCPLVLQLIHHDKEFAQFLHKPDVMYTNYEEVKAEIEAETDRKAGKNKNICKLAINLKVYSPDVPNLTLIDLPGLTKNPVEDQPADIEAVIKDMIMSFIRQENTLILALTPATQDLANSDAIKLAQEVDPNGSRTIGVLTKLDIMGPGSDARKVFDNKVIPLKRGYVGLVNRSQKDIDEKKDVKSAREHEMQFFNDHQAYKDIAYRLGAKYLTQMLSQQLIEHIREKIPTMQTQLRKENARVRQILEAMNAFHQRRDGNWQRAKLVELIQKFVSGYESNLSGDSMYVEIDDISSGAKLNNCYYTQIFPLLDTVKDLIPKKKDLFTLWQNMTGYRSMMFFTQRAFDVIIRKFLQNYNTPLESSTITASGIVKHAVSDCINTLSAYPALQQLVIRLMTEEICKNEELTIEHLKVHIKIQKSFMGIYHPDFMKPSTPKGITNGHQELDQSLDQSDSYSLSSFNDGDDISIVGDDFMTKRNEILMRGNVNVHSSLALQKLYYFVLFSDKLVWYKDENDMHPKNYLLVNGLTISTVKTKTRSKKFILQGYRGSGLTKKDFQKIMISFKRDADEDEWLDSFHKVGLVIDAGKNNLDNKEPDYNGTETLARGGTISRFKQPKSPAPTKEKGVVPVVKDNDPRYNFANDPVLDEVAQKLMSYANIIHEMIQDLSLKYISYFLVQKTLKYTKLKLLSDIQKEDIVPLMEVSAEEMAKREEYFKLYDATENALKIMGEVSAIQKII